MKVIRLILQVIAVSGLMISVVVIGILAAVGAEYLDHTNNGMVCREESQ